MGRSSYKDLIVWQKAMLLVKKTYEYTKQFPVHEKYNLTSQMQRAVISVASNIAEGQYRFSLTQNRQFLKIAYGSCAELETQIEIAMSLEYVKSDAIADYSRLIEEILMMLNTMILRKSEPTKL